MKLTSARTVNVKRRSEAGKRAVDLLLTLQTCLRNVKFLLQLGHVAQGRQEVGTVRCAIEQLLPEALDLAGQVCTDASVSRFAGRVRAEACWYHAPTCQDRSI